ncbi:endonuclease/exonuclease/phosphatase family protein [Enterobacter asburiae]|uniref:endonuclease/exonuclease/phosphatase family protein n=1 Tax=Enterobacter asburiae TaxID=61645 RepID=UPI0011D241B8|nr:endonuclease/exonuclease/phosphatase family protein [Enterobacter asburiae]
MAIKHTDLKLFYWNTSLNPPKSTKKPTPVDVNFVVQQINHLTNNKLADIIFLSEINEEYFKIINPLITTGNFLFELLNFTTKTKSIFDLAVIYNQNSVKISSSEAITNLVSKTDIKAAVKVGFTELANNTELTTYVSHWPSFRTPDAEFVKTHAANALKDNAKVHLNSGNHVIFMGDYNTEPYSIIFSTNLMATNDRKNVIDNPNDWLYNPFWKLLHSRVNFEQSLNQHDLGSCYSSSNKRPNWATFDQMFFSAAFLKNKGWSIIEDETGRFFENDILQNIEKTSSSINHHPIKTLIRYLP